MLLQPPLLRPLPCLRPPLRRRPPQLSLPAPRRVRSPPATAMILRITSRKANWWWWTHTLDAVPATRTRSLQIASIRFFCGHGATQGLVTRPKDDKAAKKAAQWAYDQSKDPDYTFDLFDPWNSDPKRLYCADFVYQSYQNAGTDLVPDKMDFFSPANKQNRSGPR